MKFGNEAESSHRRNTALDYLRMDDPSPTVDLIETGLGNNALEVVPAIPTGLEGVVR